MSESENNINVESDADNVSTDNVSSACAAQSTDDSEEEVNLFDDPQNVEYSFLLTGRSRPPGTVLVKIYDWSVMNNSTSSSLSRNIEIIKWKKLPYIGILEKNIAF